MCLVSIIIPIYNTGEILISTLDSVVRQTYENIEVILVDDGSTDTSKNICLDYVSKDPRFYYFWKENGGICSARNYGIERCHGDYIFFSDHDDIMNKNLIEKAINGIKNTDADFVKFGVILFNEDTKEKHTRAFKKNYYLNHNNLVNRIMNDINDGFYSNIWDTLFRKDFIVNNHLLFDLSYKKGYEDINFNYKLLESVGSAVYLTDILYIHILRKGLSTSSKKYMAILKCLSDNPNRINNLIETIPQIKDNQVGLCYYYIHDYLVSTISYAKQLGIHKDRIIDNISRNREDVIRNLIHVNYIKLGYYSFKKGGLKYLAIPLLFYLYKYERVKLIYSLVK